MGAWRECLHGEADAFGERRDGVLDEAQRGVGDFAGVGGGGFEACLGEVAPEFGNQSILVADKRDGKPLFGYQGPFRLVCPNDKAGARSVRMLETLEFVRLQK